jgi:hypothetical protein
MEMARIVRMMLLAGLLAAASIGVSAGGAAAYGTADNPLAQIEYSQNCNNLQLCGGGGGGVWFWVEIDGGPTSGTADVAGAGCHHIPGLFGAADSMRGETSWFWSPTIVGFDAAFGTDPADANGYYVVAFPGFGVPASFPVTVAHYSAKPAPGIVIQLQVAP